MKMTNESMDDVTHGLEKLDFHHPYTPYDVQEQFMKTVFDVLEAGDGHVGILESPTGTASADTYKDEPSWIVEQLLRRKRDELVNRWEDREKRLATLRLKEKALEQRSHKRRRIEDPSLAGSRVIDEDAEWLLDDVDDRDSDPQDALSGLSKESRDVLKSIGLGGPRARDEDEDLLEEEIKFITELRRPTFPPSLPPSLAKGDQSKTEAVKLLPLSSRQRLCINPSVSRLGSVQAINDRCSELQQSKSKNKCSFVPKDELLSQTHQFRDSALATLPDIEDLHQLGKSLGQDNGIVDANDLTRPKGIDQINMFELIQYIQESKLAYKIESYVSHVESEDATGKTTPRSSTPVLHTLVAFLIALTNLSSEGRIFYEKIKDPAPDIKLSYLLLSPTHAFSSIASSARAVVLAGGTMSPFDDFKDHLFPSLGTDKVTTLSCGHVIPPENLCVWTLSTSRPGMAPFEFSYQHRGNSEMITQLGLAILNLCSLVPDGVVIFFPSYGYLDEVVAVWQKPGAGQPIWDRLGSRKALFKETRGGSSDEVLQEYSQAILGDSSNGKGALLLSVIGGKMSEGINFSDRLGRCVIVIGLPYPNIASPDWKAKIEYIETTTKTNLIAQGVGNDSATARGKQAARDFYENACMRAVNQSIGRAIRHQGDYAAIVLVDRRYGTERIRGKLPEWIRGGLVGDSHEKGLGGLMGAVGGFFRGKKIKSTK
ncbi:hypothetical protein G7Z17_g8778 [Cylindrodendrum hubeiense]|uniref:ATP-dependent DNA helicase CHL1 n=1 Tax=Cylindrodendrum hubeiense TaxID=595255 RepID=A0A9P5H584_9HYPO|nr:hypothetical protein G7Z17_g8778 [Cylindrodendrum hubeiense]